MAILLVTYDLNKPGQDYSNFLEKIRLYPSTRLSESSYAIQTSKSPQSVYKELTPHLDKNDYIYIITLSKPYFGYGPENVNKWLEYYL